MPTELIDFGGPDPLPGPPELWGSNLIRLRNGVEVALFTAVKAWDYGQPRREGVLWCSRRSGFDAAWETPITFNAYGGISSEMAYAHGWKLIDVPSVDWPVVHCVYASGFPGTYLSRVLYHRGFGVGSWDTLWTKPAGHSNRQIVPALAPPLGSHGKVADFIDTDGYTWQSWPDADAFRPVGLLNGIEGVSLLAYNEGGYLRSHATTTPATNTQIAAITTANGQGLLERLPDGTWLLGYFFGGAYREWRSDDSVGAAWTEVSPSPSLPGGIGELWGLTHWRSRADETCVVGLDRDAGLYRVLRRGGPGEDWAGPYLNAAIDATAQGIGSAYITELPGGRWEAGWWTYPAAESSPESYRYRAADPADSWAEVS